MEAMKSSDAWRKLEADSGTKSHLEVLRRIRDLGKQTWDVQISPYYLDPITRLTVSVVRTASLMMTSSVR